MENQLALTVNGVTIAIPIGGTPEQIVATLTRYVQTKGAEPDDLTPREIGKAALKQMMIDARDVARNRRRHELRQTLTAEIEKTLAEELI